MRIYVSVFTLVMKVIELRKSTPKINKGKGVYIG